MRAGWLILLVSLAGCTDGSAVSDAPDVAVSTVLAGTVLDGAFVPLADVRVQMDETEETRTDSDGSFRFEASPGAHRLRFEHADHEPLELLVENTTAPVEVTLVPLPTDVPYAVTLHSQGYIGCAVKVAMYVYPDQCAPIGDPDRFDVLDFQTHEVPEVLQSEIVWGTTQEFGKYLGTMQYVETSEGVRQKVGNVWGESPLVCRVTQDAVCRNEDGSGGGGDGLGLTGFPGRFFASVYAACYQQCVPGTAVGAGAIFQQEYNLYATAFFNESPPADWTLQADGAWPP